MAAIPFAQAANGILLPLIGVVLLIVMNRRDLLGEYRNRTVANVAGTVSVLGCAVLAVLTVAQSLGQP